MTQEQLPAPPTQIELAAHLFLSRQTYSVQAKQLGIPENASLDEARRIYIQHLQSLTNQNIHTPENRKDLSDIKKEQEKEKLKRLQMANARTSGQLLDAEEVEFAWNSLLSEIRTKVLAVPNNLAPAIAASSGDFAEIKEILTVAMHDTLTDMSEFDVDGFLKEIVEQEDEEAPKPTTKP